jgi:hypothetical protein
MKRKLEDVISREKLSKFLEESAKMVFEEVFQTLIGIL